MLALGFFVKMALLEVTSSTRSLGRDAKANCEIHLLFHTLLWLHGVNLVTSVPLKLFQNKLTRWSLWSSTIFKSQAAEMSNGAKKTSKHLFKGLFLTFSISLSKTEETRLLGKVIYSPWAEVPEN